MIDYTDVVLSPLVTDTFEATAGVDVDHLGTFAASWRDRLITLRVYILICLEYSSTSDDPFSVKLPYYRAQFEEALTAAKASGGTLTEAQQLANKVAVANTFFVPLERA